MPSHEPVTHVLVDLTQPIAVGSSSVLVRICQDDRETVQLAAQLLGLSQADFLRTSTVQAARKVIQENAR